MNPFYQSPGALIQKDGSCHFTVWAPLKKNVALKIISPTESVVDMQQDDWGYWKAVVPDLPAGARYRYILEGENERPDPASASQPEGVHGPSQVLSKEFNWTDHSWKGISLKECILYEVHTGTFTEEGTFDAIISKIPYLLDLGINAVELMPIAQFPGSRNWGYDGVYPFAIHPDYGDAAALKRFVNACHENGMAVILDVVYNHLGPDGCYLSEFAPYYTDRYKTPWGEALNFDGPYCDGVRSYFIHNALMWLDEFHIDGLRMDAVHAIWDYSARHFMQDLNDKVRQLEEETGRIKILIAELDLNNTRYINPVEKGGYGLNGQWIDEFHHALHSLLTGETDGYYEDFGLVSHLEHAFRNTYVYNGIYSRHRKKIFGMQPEENPYSQFVVFSQNHDHIGNRPIGDRLTSILPFEKLKLAAAAVLLSPYVPLLFMGEEYGEKNPFLYFVHHQNEDLARMVSEGRKKEFSYFNFKDEFPDPQSEEVFIQSRLSWQLNNTPESAALFSFYKYLISLRKTHPAMKADHRNSMVVHESAGSILSFDRIGETQRLLIVLHFGERKEQFLNSTTSAYKKILDSSDIAWNGHEVASFDDLYPQQSADIQPLSVCIFQSI